MKSLVQSLIIILLGAVLGLAANQMSPRGIPLVPPPKTAPAPSEFIPLEQAKQLWDSGTAMFLDAREPADYAAGHIGNALNVPALEFEQSFGQIAPMLTPQSEIVVYCDGTECELSHRLAENLRSQGFTHVHILFNGWTVWSKAGLPATRGDAK